MIIKNADVFTEEGVFTSKDIYIDGSLFVESLDGEQEVIDATDCYAIPGLVDVHFHGCVGQDFCNGTKEAIDAMAEYEASQGITAIVPATMTLGKDTLMNISKAAKAYVEGEENEKGAELCGINMEGPFISMAKKGAQNPLYVHKPDVAMFREINEASGNLIKLVALAPEEEGAMEFIDELKDEVVISIAHTTANADITAQALNRGASHITHLYNAMTPFTHRDPGVVGAACDNENCEVEVICDGVHISPVVIRTTFKMFGKDRIILISDSMEATGMPDGQYSLGGQAVYVKGNRATLESGTIAGSNTNLMNCMRTAVKMNIPLETAVLCATRNPAKSVGIYDRYGSITPGKVASMVLLNKEDLSTKQVILRGKLL